MIRRAATDDVQGIGAVVHKVWGQEILPEVCQAQIEQDSSALLVAEKQGEIVGFISAFLTADEAGQRRWEVDLLAVRPSSQGHGLGQRLIKQAHQDGVPHAVDVTRALIQVSNLASQRAFERAGFTTDRREHHLLLWLPQPSDVPDPGPAGVSLLPVDTLTYRGLWIEGLTRVPPAEQRCAVRIARGMIAYQDRLNTGAVIPSDEEHLLTSDVRDQAKLHGRYFWFVRRSRARERG